MTDGGADARQFPAAMMTAVFDLGHDPVRPELLAACERTWTEIATPGTWWDGTDRVAIAYIARVARATRSTHSEGAAPPLPAAAVEAAILIATEPGTTSEAWASETCDALGELRYVELVGIVARVVAIDTFHRLTGHPLVPLPAAGAGEPTHEPAPDGLRKNHTWVAMPCPSHRSSSGRYPRRWRP